ncbi:MAG TPA: glycosyltransferase family 1 protein [Solirubrobacteraceae bacterium]|nr:glycosyltransferase family 1 protein [Solirubrobacteraceae bacterium]
MTRLRIGVPAPLLGIEPAGGHGKVWQRTLACLAQRADIEELVALGGRRRGLVRRGRLRRGRPDVVLADGHGELPETNVPVVAVIHEVGWHTPPLRALLHPAFLAGIEERTERAVRMAARVITPSESSRRDVAGLYDLKPARVHVVPYGVDATFSAGPRGGVGTVREPYVLFAAMLHPRKNLEVLRQAMALLAGEGLGHRLVVAGRPAADGSDVEAIARAAAADIPGAAGRVIFVGEVSDADLAALMAGAAAYCLPSLYEGFGLTALEAMACGTPVVVSDRGALSEVVGDAGLVVAPEPDAVAGALRAVLSDPERARQLRKAGPERARRFSWERTADGWLDVARAAAGER